MRVLVLGAKGQVGSALMARLPRRWPVTGLTRKDVDLLVPGDVAAAIETAQPDVVINAAAWTAVDRAETEATSAHRVNTDAVREIAETNVPLVVSFSTDYVFDGHKESAYKETDMPAPLNVYGMSKLGGERAIARRKGEHLIFRTSWVHAPAHVNFVSTMLRLLAERSHLSVVNDQVGAPTSAALIADSTVLALKRMEDGEPLASGIYNLTASGGCSWYDYARFIHETAREQGKTLDCALEPIAAADYGQAALRPRNSRLDTKKLQRALDFRFPPWQEGVRDTILKSMESAKGQPSRSESDAVDALSP